MVKHTEELEMQEETPEKKSSDVYDLYDDVTTVHSKDPYYNKDFTLSHLTDEPITNNKNVKFVMGEIRVCREVAQEIMHEETKKEIVEFLMGEVTGVIILGRAQQGQIVRNILDTGKAKASKDLDDEQDENFLLKEKQEKEGKEK